MKNEKFTRFNRHHAVEKKTTDSKISKIREHKSGAVEFPRWILLTDPSGEVGVVTKKKRKKRNEYIYISIFN